MTGRVLEVARERKYAGVRLAVIAHGAVFLFHALLVFAHGLAGLVD